MKTFIACSVLLALVSGCSSPPCTKHPSAVTLPPRLDSYFAEYCNYTGNMGIGFDRDHTWDYRFRLRLKSTTDPELKRLFVLRHLYDDVEFALQDFGAGRIRTGQNSCRSLTFEEWQQAQRSIQVKINDLRTDVSFTNFVSTTFDPMNRPDPSVDSAWVQELSDKFFVITNAPAANKSLHSTPR